MPMQPPPGILARGPWEIDAIEAHWHEEHFAPSDALTEAADAKMAALRDRGSPSHDGIGARFLSHREQDGRLIIELQPLRWALRLVAEDASSSMSAMCIVRDHEGRWLAGRRAQWVASWAGRWALGAGGAVDPGESPGETLTRELREEWAVEAERVRGEALLRLPQQTIMFVGQAWLAEGAQLTMDPEHDEHAWWPADPADWPPEADEPLRRIAQLLLAG